MRWKTLLSGFLLFVALLVPTGCEAPPNLLEIGAPPEGASVYQGQPVSISVHAVNPESPPLTGQVEIVGADGTTFTLELTFDETAPGYYAARAEWIPQREGEYELHVRGLLQNGQQVRGRKTVHVRVLAPRSIRKPPMQRLGQVVQPQPLQPTLPGEPTPAPTNTVAPSPIPRGTPSPSPTFVPCLLAKFVADVTIPDGTTIAPGQTFTKTWRLQNVGSCPWTAGFGVVFSDGDRMEAPDFTPLPHPVAPGEAVDVSVNLRAPTAPGRYRANFLLQSADGTRFGLTLKLRPFYVEIVVPEPTATATLTPSPVPKTDLVITQVTLQPQDPKPGQSMLVTVTVANIGPHPAGRFSTHWWMVEGGNITCGWTLDNGLAPGRSETFQCAFAAPTSVGTYTGLVGVDLPRNDVPETNEDNNEYRVSYTVVPADDKPPTVQANRDTDRVLWPPYCRPSQVTITAVVHDPSGVASVQIRYRVVQGNRVGQWVVRDFTLVGTDRYQVVLDDSALEQSLNPPLRGSQNGYIEYSILATDNAGNQGTYPQPNITLEYCVY